MYYVQSRYYDPVVKRMICADDESIVAGATLSNNNLFAYCDNNPVNCQDKEGKYAMAIAASYGAANAWNAVGWAVLATVAVVVTVHAVKSFSSYYHSKRSNISYSRGSRRKTTSKSRKEAQKQADPYGRSGQKKQGREIKEKKKSNGRYSGNANKTRQKPKKHTPGRDHRRHKPKAKKAKK